MSVTDWIQSIGLSIAIMGVIISIIYSRKQLKIFDKQLKLNFFADYTKRYQEIMLHLSGDIFKDDFNFSHLSQEKRNETLNYMRAYFDLCSEEHFLFIKKHIDEDVWKEWDEGIRASFKRKAFQDAWQQIDMKSYKGFTNYLIQEKLI
jgi:hypothetical protein